MRDAVFLFSSHSAVIYPSFSHRKGLRKERKIYEECGEDCYARPDVTENQLARHSNSSGGFPNIGMIY